jgi:hypothetical protein
MIDMINDFGEDVPAEKISEIAQRITSLSDAQIDELWSMCDLVYEKPKSILYPDRNKYFKALFDDLIEEIRRDKEESTTLLTLIRETPLDEILEDLNFLENEKAK